MRSILLLSAVLLSLSPQDARSQASADSAAIREAALNYIEGWYEGNADRMAKAVHGDLAKQIVTRGRPGAREYVRDMSATELVEGTRAGGGTQTPSERRRKDVTILDISYGKAASVKVVASDWVDYLHVAKVDGQWKIVNVLWERTPATP